MGAIVAFDYKRWLARYPEFSQVTEATALEYFAEASIYQANDGSGPVDDANVQLLMLNMLVAHLAMIYQGPKGNPAGQVVGRITSASEGSVSVGLENPYPPGTVQWFQQTKYGSQWYAAARSAGGMNMRYRPGNPRPADPFRRWFR